MYVDSDHLNQLSCSIQSLVIHYVRNPSDQEPIFQWESSEWTIYARGATHQALGIPRSVHRALFVELY